MNSHSLASSETVIAPGLWNSERRCRFGLNYVPSRRWYYCWNDWNRDDIAADFDAMASLGIDHVRVQLVWPWFQPNPASVSQAHLARLKELVGVAAERKIDVLVCPLTGWLSGYSFLPPGITGEDIFLKNEVFEQSLLYFHALIEALRGLPNWIGFDLGNELNVLVPDLSAIQGDAWGKKICGQLRPHMEGKWLVNGVDHNPWFSGQIFGVRHLVEEYDAICLHAWPKFTGCLLNAGLADSPSLHLSAFMTALARRFLRQSGMAKPVWIQEFGCSSLWGDEKEKAAYLRQSVSLAADAGATWFTWWCSHDIDPTYRFDPLEYDLGLFTTENKRKPLAQLYASLIQDFSTARSDSVTAKLEVSVDRDFAPQILRQLPRGEWLKQNLETTSWQLFERYLEVAASEAPSKAAVILK